MLRYEVIEEFTAEEFAAKLNAAASAIVASGGVIERTHILTPTYGVDERRYGFVAVIEYWPQEDA